MRALGAEAVEDDGFPGNVLDATDGRGADVVLELVGAPHFPANLEALAPRDASSSSGSAPGPRRRFPCNA